MRIRTVLLLVALLLSPALHTIADDNVAKPAIDQSSASTEPAETGPTSEDETEPSATEGEEETPIEEQLTNEEKNWIKEEAMPELEKKSPEELQKEVSSTRKLALDAVIIVSYTYANSPDSYKIKYHIDMGGTMHADTGVIKGNSKVATDIGGFLAKASAFECLLKVSITDVPYEIVFTKTSDTEANIAVTFKDQILEDWDSLCTFLDGSGAKFNTRGTPERWIGPAIEKAKPSLSKLVTPIDPAKTTTLKFTIAKHTVEDEAVGSAEVEGTGVVTVEPVIAKKPAVTEDENHKTDSL